MPNPIAKLKGEEKLPPVTLPAPVRVAQPAPPPPPPTQDLQTQAAPPIGGSLSDPALSEAGLPQLPTVVGETSAPQIDFQSEEPNAAVSRILAPDVAAGVYQVDKEIQQGQLGIAQAEEFPRIYTPPDLNSVVQGFVQDAGEQQAMLRRTIKDEQTRDVAQRMLEQLRSIPQTQGSSTSPAFDWVNRLLGVSEDGGRNYAGPAVFNKQTGEWEGSPIGGILYLLGLPQNTVMGTALDLSQIYRKGEEVMSAVYERAVPPWLRNQITTLAQATAPLVPLASAAQQVLKLIPQKDNRYFDGKSNLVEALRGAQYSFADEAGKGFGIKQNVGVRVGGAKGSKQFGFDLNPTVVGGVALDLLVGDRTDALLNVLGKAAKAQRLTDVLTLTPRPVQAAKTVGKARSAPVSTIPKEGLQLQLPFVVNPQAPKKAKFPKINALGGKVQKLKPVKIAGTKGKQLDIEFPLEVIVASPKPGRDILEEGTKLNLPAKYDVMPEALDPAKLGRMTTNTVVPSKTLDDLIPDEAVLQQMSVEELIALANKVGSTPLEGATQAADLLNNLAAATDSNLYRLLDEVDGSPDIGRQFVGGDDIAEYSAPVNPTPVQVKTAPPPAPVMYHGTRVEGLDIGNVNPISGAARSELGPGIYLSTDPELARRASQAQVNINLPAVEGRSFGIPTLHTVDVSSLRLIDGNAPSSSLTKLANEVAEGVDGMQPEFYGVKSVVDVFDDAAIINSDEAVQLAFQRSMAEELVKQGYDGARTGNTVAVYNPVTLRSTTEVVPDVASVSQSVAKRAEVELDSVIQTSGKSQTAITNALESDSRHLVQITDDIEILKPKVEADVMQAVDDAKLMEHPTLDEVMEQTSIGESLKKLGLPDDELAALSKKMDELGPEEFAEFLVTKHPELFDDMFETILENESIYKSNPCGF